MRYSESKRLDVKDIQRTGPAAAMKKAASETTADERCGALLLVGGTSHGDLAVREAQAPLRLDRRASLWSHAAIILDWRDGAAPGEAIGIEVSLAPGEPHHQLPERNGATFFRLERYLDAARYPNLALAILKDSESEKPGVAKARRSKLVEAALHPEREHMRFPLFEWLGEWHSHIHGRAPNPLLHQTPHPGAAFCEAVYRTAGLDPASSATDLNTCPEVIWSSLLYWYGCMSPEQGRLCVYRRRGDPYGGRRHPGKPPPLRREFSRLLRATGKRP